MDEVELQTKPIQISRALEWLIKVTRSSGDTTLYYRPFDPFPNPFPNGS